MHFTASPIHPGPARHGPNSMVDCTPVAGVRLCARVWRWRKRLPAVSGAGSWKRVTITMTANVGMPLFHNTRSHVTEIQANTQTHKHTHTHTHTYTHTHTHIHTHEYASKRTGVHTRSHEAVMGLPLVVRADLTPAKRIGVKTGERGGGRREVGSLRTAIQGVELWRLQWRGVPAIR